MSEEPTVKIVLCPFNMGRACMTTACRLWETTNQMCVFEVMLSLEASIIDLLGALGEKKPPRKRPPKKEEPTKE